ncbi:unnamed protein product [Ectocarpus sp. 8 AP-2014]
MPNVSKHECLCIALTPALTRSHLFIGRKHVLGNPPASRQRQQAFPHGSPLELLQHHQPEQSPPKIRVFSHEGGSLLLPLRSRRRRHRYSSVSTRYVWRHRRGRLLGDTTFMNDAAAALSRRRQRGFGPFSCPSRCIRPASTLRLQLVSGDPQPLHYLSHSRHVARAQLLLLLLPPYSRPPRSKANSSSFRLLCLVPLDPAGGPRRAQRTPPPSPPLSIALLSSGHLRRLRLLVPNPLPPIPGIVAVVVTLSLPRVRGRRGHVAPWGR